ncbi:hypothetical protein M422DRAFT_48908 [Sphaerobolus stellatus SS14]|uniref:Uncharacterized protein n=1 Tax=Sphaerobolus stellatus (strain SS14) TaxID=990650 RepID=A0A0C9VRC1_SPHS4|nr:hypothetical protein M422DRAFT_48908 [Sphaerobolus stellatus SS14]
MGRKSNLAKLRIQLAVKAQEKASEHRDSSPSLACESGSDMDYIPEDPIQQKLIDLEKGVIPEWDDSGSKSDDEDILDEDAEAEARDDAALLTFTSCLQDAQELLDKAQREKNASRKRPKKYLGNSDRTKRCWAQKRCKLIELNPKHKFITHWFHPQPLKTSEVPGKISEAPIAPQAIDLVSEGEETPDQPVCPFVMLKTQTDQIKGYFDNI